MSNTRKNEIAENLKELLHEIEEYAIKANRDPKEIELICVSKNYPLTDVLLANEVGATEFGENRVQEFEQKQFEFYGLPEGLKKDHQFNWHLIGTLQRNKVKDVVAQVKLIHSVDSERLIKQIARVSKRYSVTTEFLLQMNIAQEETKHGFSIQDIESAIDLSLRLDNIKLRGLMTMAPHYQDASKTEVIFAKTRELLNKHKPTVGAEFNQLSMGMSNDYPYAIAQGATLIRIGARIFGERNYR